MCMNAKFYATKINQEGCWSILLLCVLKNYVYILLLCVLKNRRKYSFLAGEEKNSAELDVPSLKSCQQTLLIMEQFPELQIYFYL